VKGSITDPVAGGALLSHTHKASRGKCQKKTPQHCPFPAAQITNSLSFEG